MGGKRDRQSEVVVAVIIVSILAFGLLFSIALSIGNDENSSEENTVDDGTASINVLPVDQNETPFSDISPTVSITEPVTELPETDPTIELTELATNPPAPEQTETPASEATIQATATSTPGQVITIGPQNTTPEATAQPTEIATDELTIEPTATATASRTPRPSRTASPTATATMADTETPTATRTRRPTRTPSATATATPTPTRTPTATTTASRTPRPSRTPTPTETVTPSLTFTPTYTVTPSPTLTLTPFPTLDFDVRATLTAEACAPQEDWHPYIIQEGDTLFQLAFTSGLRTSTLRAGNCLEGNRIYAGNVILLPPDSPLLTGQSGTNGFTANCPDPTVIISSPEPGELMGNVFTVYGTADYIDFGYYVLELKLNSDYQSIFTGTLRVAPGRELGIVAIGSDTPPGTYTLRLTVYNSRNEAAVSCTVPFTYER